MAHLTQYPVATVAELRDQFVGKHLSDVAPPAAIVDRAIVKANCEQMLNACQKFHVKFRPHIKTHKVLSEIYDLSFTRELN